MTQPATQPVPAGRPTITLSRARAAAARIKTLPDGRRVFVRFDLGRRIEHHLLIASFTALAVTGLIQTFSSTTAGALAIQLLGGIGTVRQFHHVFAALFIAEALYHIVVFLYGLVMHGNWGGMWPSMLDVDQLLEALSRNLGLSKRPVPFGRYTFEQKAEYWALLGSAALLIVTGFMQWFPALVTQWLPGQAIPVARAAHGGQAILSVLAVLTWHAYHVVIKRFNRSIFTGTLTEPEMRAEHPGELDELLRITAALDAFAGAPAPLAAEPAAETALAAEPAAAETQPALEAQHDA